MLSDLRTLDIVTYSISYNKLSTDNGMSWENILPAVRHLILEQNQELAPAQIQLQLEMEAIARGHRQRRQAATP